MIPKRGRMMRYCLYKVKKKPEMIDCLGLQTKEAKLNCKRLEVTSEGEAAHDGWRVSVTVLSINAC